MLAALLSCAPMAAQGMRFAVRRLRMQRSLRPQRLRGRVVMRLGGGAFEFPEEDRWRPHLLRDAPEATTVRVLREAEYDAWLAARPDETRAYLEAAGLGEFKGDALALLPERTWAFLTKDPSKLFAFSSLPSRLPGAGPYALEFAAPPPATAALSWGLGCYSFEACKGSTAPKADAPPKFASLVVPAENDYGDAAAALKGTYLCRDLINAPAGDMRRPAAVTIFESF